MEKKNNNKIKSGYAKNGAAYATAGSLSQSWDRGPNFSLYFFFFFFFFIYRYDRSIGLMAFFFMIKSSSLNN
jgi:hypothetical protein